MINFRGILIRWKVSIDRSRMYFGYIQFFMIGILLLKNYQHTVIGEWVFTHQFISMPLLFLIMIFLSIFVGWIDKKLGIRGAENVHINQYNPHIMQILKDIEYIKKATEQRQSLKQNNNGKH